MGDKPSCSERVKDDESPAMASPDLSAQSPEPLPQSSKGGMRAGDGGAGKPWARELDWGELRAMFPLREQQGREGSQCFQSWLLHFITAAFSRLVWQQEL